MQRAGRWLWPVMPLRGQAGAGNGADGSAGRGQVQQLAAGQHRDPRPRAGVSQPEPPWCRRPRASSIPPGCGLAPRPGRGSWCCSLTPGDGPRNPGGLITQDTAPSPLRYRHPPARPQVTAALGRLSARRAYGAVDSNFVYLEFAGTMLPDLVFVEGLVSHLYLERPDELDRYREALDCLRDDALNPRDSAKKIEEIRNEL